MRRDGGCHANRNAGRPIRQQIRKRARQHHRLALLAIIGWPEINRVFIDPAEQKFRHLGQARLRIALGRRIIPINIAEIALAFHQRVARREILRQADQRFIDGDIAVRVEFAHHIAHHARAFLEAGARVQF